MLIRPPSRIFRNVRKPSPRSPRRLSAGIRQRSNASSPVADACSPSLSSMRTTRKPGVSAGRMNAEISAWPSSLRARAGGDDVGARLAGVGDEPLAAVDDPLALRVGRPFGPALAVGPSKRAVVLRPAGVGAGARLGEAVRADDLAARHRDEVAVLLLLGAREVQRAAAERRVRRDDQPERAPDAPDLLDRDRVGERVHAGAALVLGDRDAEPAHLAEPPDDLDRELVLALVLLDDRRDLLLHEVADRRPEQLVLRGEVQVHRPERTKGLHATAAATMFLLASRACPRHRGQPASRPVAAPIRPRSSGGPMAPPRLGAAPSDPHPPAPASGPRSPDAVAAALEASRTGVLQQLHALEAAGLVSHAAEKHGVGRPRHLYDVTSDAQGLFPADYGGFASGLVKAIEAVGGDDLVEQVFAARRHQIGDRMRRRMAERLPEDATLAERVQRPRRPAGRGGLPRRGGGRRTTARSGSASTTARSTRSPAGRRRRARRSWRCSRSCSGRASCASRTSPRATAAAPTSSRRVSSDSGTDAGPGRLGRAPGSTR